MNKVIQSHIEREFPNRTVFFSDKSISPSISTAEREIEGTDVRLMFSGPGGGCTENYVMWSIA